MRMGVVVLCAMACGLAAAVDAAAAEPVLKAGAARVEIVPDFPTRMGGFFDRKDTFRGVSTPIHARALVCDNGTEQVALVSMDLVLVSRNLVDAARAEAAKRTGIAAEDILICASHTHSAPSGFQEISHYDGEFDPRLLDFLVEQIATAIQQAHSTLQPVVVGHGSGHLDVLTRNRQGNNTVIDPEVSVLLYQVPETRETVATVFNFTGHPVILGSDNLDLSGEYPGQAQRTVESVLGGVALFTQGACGDITVHRSGDPYLEVERVGKVLAGEVIRTASLIRPDQNPALVSEFVEVALPTRPILSLAEAKAAHEQALAALEQAPEGPARSRLRQAVDTATWELRIAEAATERPKLFDDAAHGSVHLMQLGPLVLVGIPGELFVEYGLEMKQRVHASTGHPMALVGYANDYIGYIVTPRAWYTGGYERAVTRVDIHAGRILTEKAMALVDEHIQD